MLNSPSATAASSSAAVAAVDDYDSDGEAVPKESDNLVVSIDDDDDDGDNDDVDDNVNEDVIFAPPGTSRTGCPKTLGRQPWRTAASVSSSGRVSASSSKSGT